MSAEGDEPPAPQSTVSGSIIVDDDARLELSATLGVTRLIEWK